MVNIMKVNLVTIFISTCFFSSDNLKVLSTYICLRVLCIKGTLAFALIMSFVCRNKFKGFCYVSEKFCAESKVPDDKVLE